MRTCSSIVISLLSLSLGACVADSGADPADPEGGTEAPTEGTAYIAAAPNWAAGLPVDAIVGGRDSDGAPLYMCRGSWNGGIHPGKTRREWGGACDIGYGGGESFATDAQVLVPAWAGASNGAVPQGAVAYGNEATGEALFVCRATYGTGVQLGKVRAGYNGCYIPYGGQEVHVPSYEVLVSPNRLPLHATWAPGALPPDAIIGGRDNDGALLYPCVASYAGGWQIGKTRAGWNGCDISYGGGEVWVGLYSVLTPEFNATVLNPATRPFAAGSENGVALGLCTAPYANGVQVGKYLSNQRCNFGYGGAEISLTTGFSVLSTWATTTPISYDSGYITFDNGVPVGGFTKLVVGYDGSYTFSGHFHDSGAWCFNDKLALVLKSKSGHAFNFSHGGSMGGTFCSGSRDDDFTVSGTNLELAAAWTDLQAGYVVHWDASSSLDFGSLFKTVMDGIGYVQTAVTIVAAF